MWRLLAEDGEIVLGTLSADGIEIDVDVLTSEREVAEQLELAGSESQVFVGTFPAPDDGNAAITVLVADSDGSVRHEPH